MGRRVRGRRGRGEGGGRQEGEGGEREGRESQPNVDLFDVGMLDWIPYGQQDYTTDSDTCGEMVQTTRRVEIDNVTFDRP